MELRTQLAIEEGGDELRREEGLIFDLVSSEDDRLDGQAHAYI